MIHLLFLSILPLSSFAEDQLQLRHQVEDAFLINEVAMNETHIAILSRMPPFVQVLDHEFRSFGQWGIRGQGPGEFTHPEGICLVGSEVWVLNKLPNRILKFSLTGDFLRADKLDQAVFPIEIKANQKVVVIQDGGLFKNPNKLFTVKPGEMSLMLELDLGEVLTLSGNSGPSFSLKSPYSAGQLWDLQTSGNLVIYTPEAGVSHHDSRMQLLKRWQPRESAYLIPDEARSLWLDKYFAISSSLPVSVWREKAEKVAMPKTFAQVLDMKVEGSNVWLLRAYQQQGQLWECYENGQLVSTLRLPFSSIPHIIYNDMVILSDPAQDTPLSIYSLKRKDL